MLHLILLLHFALLAFPLSFRTAAQPAHASKTDVDFCNLHGAVYIESVESFAQYKVFVEDVEAFADVLIFREMAQSFADRPGLWYITDVRAFADFTVAYTDVKGFADFSVFYTDFKSIAGCRK